MSPRRTAVTILLLALAWPISAQWTNRYQRIGTGHHVYIEGYDFPTYSAGPTYPAISPDGRSVAFSARGWIWMMDLEEGTTAYRLTKAGGMDSRPAWRPDGNAVAFVRDDTRNTDIVEVDVHSGTETVLVDSPAAELDPAYSPDGAALYYASAETGDMEIYRLDLTTREKTRITNARGLDLRPQPLADGSVLFVSKRGGADEIAALDAHGVRRVIAAEPIASLARPAVDPEGRRVAVPLPAGDGWALYLMEVSGGPAIQIVSGAGHPIMPAWSANGRTIFFVQAGDDGAFGLWRIPVGGGQPEEIAPSRWVWGEPTARVVVTTRIQGSANPVPARLHVVDHRGHPAFPERRRVWFEGQNGLVFTYSPGELEFVVPVGEFRVMASYGFEHMTARATGSVQAGQQVVVNLELAALGGPALDEWYSGDHHFHLNYGGPSRLAPGDLVEIMGAENLDVATPLSANLHTRHIDEAWFGWTRHEQPLIAFGQEVRPHFLGHTGHIGMRSLFWPWYWGPGYPVYGRDDRSNAEALAHTRRQGGVTSYVHPVTPRAPFGEAQPRGLPLELVSDAVLGDLDALEVACLWSDELGTSEAWYRLLNVGIPIVPTAGTDVMTDLFRTMAIGTTRVYVKVPGELTLARYLEGLKAGRSFVTTGPLLRLQVNGAGPGDTIGGTAGSTGAWELIAGSSMPFESIEIIVNGQIAWTGEGLKQPGVVVHRGNITVPAGGWVAARVHGGPVVWPAMDSYPFAHTAPIWFGSIGSRDPDAAGRAAQDLLAALQVAEQRLAQGYGDAPISNLRGRIAEARRKLESIAR